MSFKSIRIALGILALIVALLQLIPAAYADQAAEPTITAPTANTNAAQGEKKRRMVIMPAVMDYMPTDSKTRDRFGDSWFNIGFVMGLGVADRIYDKVEFHIDGILKSSDNGHVYMFPVGFIYTVRPAKVDYMSPYVGASADAYFINLKSDQDNISSTWKTTAGGSIFAGVDINKHLALKVSYLFVPTVESFNFSGVNAMATIAF